MTTIRAYTTVEQSRKLAEVLPIESADMCYLQENGQAKTISPLKLSEILNVSKPQVIPCWSLTALLGVLPFHLIVNNQRYAFSMHKGLNKNGETYIFRYNIFNTDICLYETEYYNSPIDACVAMIEKLKELNLL